MNFPDRIFSIGGAGKEMALTILETDWIIDDILAPRPSPESLTVTIIDSAEGEENSDRERINNIRANINEREQELRDPEEGRTGSIDVEYKLLTTNIQLNSNIDLLGDDAVDRITAGNGMKKEHWWLQDRFINENLDFAKGVVRKRGLGKAIYYKAYAEDDEISSYIDLPQKGKVAVLAGLGGGTGSGILIDLARHLRDRQRTAEITLFGILPNHVEGLEENTNAHAALTELEYLALNGAGVFKDRILVPIDPTDFGGKTGDRIQTDQFLQELDEAMVYMMASYYNTRGLEDPFADSPDYAPFTIGIPQVLRYRVEAINEARENVRETLNKRSEALQIEEEIYSTVQRYLDREYTTDYERGVRELDEADLRERLKQTRELMEFELFTDLNYQSVSIFEDILEEAEQEAAAITDEIDLISTSMRAVDTSGDEVGTFVDNIDEHLAEILEQELQLISRRKEILEQLKVVDDNRVRDALEYLLNSGDDSSPPGVKLNRLETQFEDLDEQRERLESDLEETTTELEEVREEQSAKVERMLTDWESSVEPKLDQLKQCDVDSVRSNLRTLEGELDEFRTQIINAKDESEVEGVSGSEVSDVLDKLAADLNEVGIDITETKREIEGSLNELKQCRTSYIKMNSEESTFEKLTPWESSTEEEQQEGHKNFRVQKNKLNERGVFEVGPPTGNFTAELAFDVESILRDVEDREERLREDVVDTLRAKVDTLSQETIRELNTELTAGQPTIDGLREVAREAFWNDIEATDDLEAEKEQIEGELEGVESDIGVYEPTIEMFQSISSRRESWENKLSEFNSERKKLNQSSREPAHAQEDDYVYIKQIQPNDIFQATGNDDIADSDLVQSRQESQRIYDGLQELANNARNQQYTGLQRRKISKGRQRYDDLKIRVAILSRAVDDMNPEDLDFADTFRGAFDLGQGGKRVESPYTSWSSDVGGPWDFGFSVYINGVFLDNIRKVVQSDGYYAGYKTKEEREGDGILIHHSHGLEDGFYVRRTKLLNMEDNDDVGFYLQDDNQIVDELLEDYIERVDFTQTAQTDD